MEDRSMCLSTDIIALKPLNWYHACKLLIQGCTNNNTTASNIAWPKCNIPADEVTSLPLLKEVIDLWFTIRGFSVANKLFEEHKSASKMNIKGKKG